MSGFTHGVCRRGPGPRGATSQYLSISRRECSHRSTPRPLPPQTPAPLLLSLSHRRAGPPLWCPHCSVSSGSVLWVSSPPLGGFNLSVRPPLPLTYYRLPPVVFDRWRRVCAPRTTATNRWRTSLERSSSVDPVGDQSLLSACVCVCVCTL